jgi:hypothetical protein
VIDINFPDRSGTADLASVHQEDASNPRKGIGNCPQTAEGNQTWEKRPFAFPQYLAQVADAWGMKLVIQMVTQ